MAGDADPTARELSKAAASEPTPAALSETDEENTQQGGGNDVTRAKTDDAAEHDGASGDEVDEAERGAVAQEPKSHVRMAAVAGISAVVVIAALVGWLGYQTYESRQAQQERDLFVQVGRQGALNLTTIDWQHADADVQRVLDSSTGTFRDDFANRQQAFIDVVKQAQSKSVGTIKDAGLESESGNQAVVLVAVSVKTTNLGAAEQEPRAWRMRISVEKVDDDLKVSNVQFVP